MFTFLSRFRRQTAVLTALALVASVLVAVPVSAADDPPKADYEATFSACVGAATGDQGFTDVPSGHENAGDINCIAYYGITQGTSATTYSPLMSVTREHMALFLTRLAARVGIEMVSDPADAGFTDIGDLSDESQTAINQLADLDITQGTSATTYSPADAVQRDHMALFISRLMDKMTPMTDGDDSEGDFGYTPSDVVDNDQDKKIGSPFTDLGPTTKSAFDAITNLWELGVASGINATSYGPSQSITRASMAGFMAGVLDHSNARPAGLSIQASPGTAYGVVDSGSVVVSVRSDGFAAVADQAVDVFNSETGALDEDGKCKTGEAAPSGDCTWSNNDEFTDGDGNIILTGEATEGETRVYYAWIGDEDGDEFDSDDVDEVTASIASSNAEGSIKVSTSLAKQTIGDQADLDKLKSVTITVQLVDGEEDGDGNAQGDPVARAGIKISVGVMQSPDANNDDTGDRVAYNNTAVATLTTDEDGKATYVVDAPDDDDDKNDEHSGADDGNGGTFAATANLENRIDVITFTNLAADSGGSTVLSGGNANASVTITWTEENPVTSSSTGTAPVYVIPDKDGDVTITATMTLYDQFGRGFREAAGHMVGINIGTGGEGTANVNRNGTASRRVVLGDDAGETVTVGTEIVVAYVAEPGTATTNDAVTDITGDGNAQGNKQVQVVTRADDEDTGAMTVDNLLGDDDEFLADDGRVTTPNSDLVYSYDEDDIFINGVGSTESTGERISIEKFEEMLGSKLQAANTPIVTEAVVRVIAYKPGGVSIFQVTTMASAT